MDSCIKNWFASRIMDDIISFQQLNVLNYSICYLWLQVLIFQSFTQSSTTECLQIWINTFKRVDVQAEMGSPVMRSYFITVIVFAVKYPKNVRTILNLKPVVDKSCLLATYFGEEQKHTIVQHSCCDICYRVCECGNCSNSKSFVERLYTGDTPASQSDFDIDENLSDCSE